MILRELESKDQESFETFLEVWDGAFGEALIYGLVADMNFSSYLSLLNEKKVGINLIEGHVPSTSLFAFVDNEIVGKVSVRHHLNENLENIGGHIGYGVIPDHRKKGFASEMLKQGLNYCRAINLTKVLVTCNEDNMASIKVIIKNGGQFENVFCPQDGSSNKKRYWIQL